MQQLPKTVLVTGGAGFIGTNLCAKLLAQGKRVIALDNFITSTGENLQVHKDNPNFIFIKRDIIKPMLELFKDDIHIDEIYHLACPTGVPNLITLAEEMLLTCSIGTRNVMELAIHHKAKVLLTSSSEAYGDPEVFPQKEEYSGNVSTTGVRSVYEEGKRFAESIVAMYVRKYKVNAKIVRIFNTYGPFMNLKESRVIPSMINQIMMGKPLTVQGNGSQNRTFCYVDDLVDGFITIMSKGKSGQVYNLGSDQQITIKELAKLFITITGLNLKIKYCKRPFHDHRGRLPSLKKAKALGWKPRTNLIKGIMKTLRWYGVYKESSIWHGI